MNHHLSVTVRVDLDDSTIQLAVTGCLTEDSHKTLLALALRARSLTPSGQVTVDLTDTAHIEAVGLNKLRSAMEHDGHGQPVLFRVPEPLPLCCASSAVAAMSMT